MPRQDANRRQLPLIEALRVPAVFGGDCTAVEVVETHISWVLLTGEFAYKIKKPVDARVPRLHRRSSRAAASATRSCGSTGGSRPTSTSTSSPSPAARTRRRSAATARRSNTRCGCASSRSRRCCRACSPRRLSRPPTSTRWRRRSRRSTGASPCAGDDRHGAPAEILRFADDNFPQIAAAGGCAGDGAGARPAAGVDPPGRTRRCAVSSPRAAATGCVRECHGDLHLGNIARIDGAITIFDGIEFNEPLRWIDVASEIAFLAMDLDDRGQPTFAHRFLNAYARGDRRLRRRSRCCASTSSTARWCAPRSRACARGQLRAGTRRASDARRVPRLRRPRRAREPARVRSAVVITHGLSGSGKSTVCAGSWSKRWARCACAPTSSASACSARRPAGLGDRRRSVRAGRDARTYARVADSPARSWRRPHVAASTPPSSRRWHRDLFRSLAATLGVPFVIVDCTAAESTLRRASTRGAPQGQRSVGSRRRGARGPIRRGRPAG